MALQEYDFTIRHQNGTRNAVADALTRAPVGPPEVTDPAERFICALDGFSLSKPEIAELQQADPGFQPLISRLQGLQDDMSISYRSIYI